MNKLKFLIGNLIYAYPSADNFEVTPGSRVFYAVIKVNGCF